MDIFQSLLFKLAPSLAGRALCSLMGFYSAGLTLTILLAALLTWDANPYSMLPGSSHQPHVPEHQVPQEHFPEHAVAHRSEPGEIELKQPLLLDQERQTELESRLNRHFIIGIRRPNELYTVAYVGMKKGTRASESKEEPLSPSSRGFNKCWATKVSSSFLTPQAARRIKWAH
ncbi:hypothetical protein ACFE04_019674 [Oxalis oulophora]